MENKRAFWFCLLICIFYLKTNAQIITDRPNQTESSSTIPKSALQIESGFFLGIEEENQFSIRQILLPSTLFRYGIGKKIEIRVLSQYERIKGKSQEIDGISDLAIGTKIQLLRKEHLNTEIAFLTHLILPSGSTELTIDRYGTSNKLSFSHAINESLGIGYNIGYNYFGKNNGDFIYSISFGLRINERVSIFAEPFGAIENMEDFISNFDAGFIYLTNPNLQFDFSFGVGLNQNMNFLSLGCSWLICKS